VEATTSTGAINSNASFTAPATLVGSAAGSTFAVGGYVFGLHVNNGAEQTFTFTGAAGASLAASTVVSEINSGITGVLAELYDDGATTYIVIKTATAGAGTRLLVGTSMAALVNTALGFSTYQSSDGQGSYGNNDVYLRHTNLPVNKGNLTDRTVDTSTVRAFLNIGGTLKEMDDDEVTIRPSTDLPGSAALGVVARGARAQDDGDGDATTPYIRVKGTPASFTFGTGNHSFTITALENGNVSGAYGNTRANIIFTVTALGTGALTVTTSGDWSFSGAENITITIGDANTAIQTYAELVAGLNAYANFSDHFVVSLPSGTTGVDAISGAEEDNHTFTTTLLRGGGDVPVALNAAAAVCTLLSNKTAVAPTVTGLTLIFRCNGGPLQTVTFTNDTIAQVVLDINTTSGGTGGTPVHGVISSNNTNRLQMVAPAAPTGMESTIEILGGTAFAALYGTAAAATQTWRANLVAGATKTHTFTCRSGSVLDDTAGITVTMQMTVAASPSTAALTVTVTGGNDAPSAYHIQVGEDNPTVATYADLVDALNAHGDFAINMVATLTGTGAGVIIPGDNYVPTALGAGGGGAAETDYHDGTAAVTVTDFNTGRPSLGKHYGSPHPCVAGYEFWGDGTLVGKIVSVANAVTGTKTYTNVALRLDTEVALTKSYTNWFVRAISLPSTTPAAGPTPELIVAANGDVTLVENCHRDNGGMPLPSSGSSADSMYLQYDALRLDVTQAATTTTPALVRYSSTTDLETYLGPINQDNPLALGMYLALLNAPNIEVTGIGVDEISTAAPDGTPDAYARAADFLEAQEVFAIAPLTQDQVVHQIFSAHVTAQSGVDEKHERYAFINAVEPSRKADEVVASGLSGESTGVAGEFYVSLSEANLIQAVTNLTNPAVAAPSAPTVADGIFLQVVSANARYSVASISASNIITIRTSFAAGENDDNFYSTSAISTTLLNEDWSMKRRGAAVSTNTEIVTAMSDTAIAYGNRRLIYLQPDNTTVTIDGLNQSVEGYYLCAGYAGLTGQQNPAQPFTNFPLTGYVSVNKSNNKFTTTQLDTAAAGGVWWVIQDVAGAPLTCRHQLTTDTSTVEKREYSIGKAVDYVAKFLRGSLGRFIGRYVINDALLQILSTVAQGVMAVLSEAAVIKSGDVNLIVQDTVNPDRVLVDVLLEVLYPCNYIRITLII